MVGQRIGNYQIVQRLGEGGMATVYLALHPELGRRVAVKVLNLDLARSAEMVQRFFNEARAASGIGHRGIVEVSDLGTLPSGSPYLVMELLEGESLADRMARAGSMPLGEAAEITGQAAGVMAAAHAGGIIHRDLKPENLYLTPDPLLPGRTLVKVLDFGIAKLAQRPVVEGGGDLRTRTGAILGTPRYMSPEQCRESRDVDHRADVYSLGVVLYEMVAGVPPFASSSWGELAHMHIGVEPPALQTHVPNVPLAVAEVVHRALQKDPAARFQSMAAFDSALRAAVAAGATMGGPENRSDRVTAGTGQVVAPRAQATTPGLGPSSEPGATRRFETPVGGTARSSRSPRKTTLESAALEMVRPQRSRRVVPLVLSLGAAAAVGVAGALVLLSGPRSSAPAPAAEVDITAPTAAAPPPVTAPAPVRTPPAVVPEAAPPPPDAAAVATDPPVEPAPAPPAPPRRRRRALAPDRPAKGQKDAGAPASSPRPVAPSLPREPLKI